jgi:hypothetical protein
VKKDLSIIAGLFLLILFLIIFGGPFTSLGFVTNQKSVFDAPQKTPDVNLTIGSLSVKARVANTTALRKKGLSKMDSLPFGQGMLFVFDKNAVYGIWMKDMKFAIDILWLDENKKVTDIVTEVPPEEGKKDSELTIYNPTHNSKYVLEINAGLVKLNNIHAGDQANFEVLK